MGFRGNQRSLMVSNKSLGVSQARWRGWGVKVTPQGKLVPVWRACDPPADWVPTAPATCSTPISRATGSAPTPAPHAIRGVLPSPRGPGLDGPSGFTDQGHPGDPRGVPLPEAVKRLKHPKPPAVWFPYKKVGQSATDIVLDDSHGRFGPFDGQLFIGEFTLASISRCSWKRSRRVPGSCFPFREGLASAVIRLSQGHDGSLFAGLSNRGWSSLGTASYGLQRLVWTGKTPFEMKEIRARPDGFELVMTRPVDPESAQRLSSYTVNSYTYTYHSTYGSDEILKRDLAIRSITVSEDGLRIRLRIAGLREMYVHELHAPGLRSRDGQPLLHPSGYYTLNRIPAR
ncbi:MAG: hypothetical protein CM1200mP2_48720 [Planctomycetaceae bacterium]|nr:MAG: hypothetical protein CM1200mP2_48720 [Planctomycetaceae bacterium]